ARRRSGVGEPVEADIVEHRIGGEFIFRIAVIVGPCLELLVDPQRLTRGRIRKRVAYCLRARSLLAEIAALVTSKPRRTVDRPAFRRCGVLGKLLRVYEL